MSSAAGPPRALGMPDREVYHQSRLSQVKTEQDDRNAFGRQAHARP